ncbi:MAG: hypothetical protein CYG61_07280 [Actinobacteria bacterium]|nr:MAG: hypothetical protein CYG61_07280 [Actinomycetota bacterium]
MEVRWNSSSGPILATAMGPSFSVNVTIPDAKAGFYYILGVAQDAGGNGVARAVLFEVVVSAPSNSPSSPESPAPSASTSTSTHIDDPAVGADVAVRVTSPAPAVAG